MGNGSRVGSREYLLSQAVAIVTAGGSLDIVGDRGVGRTMFLEQLRGRLRIESWRTVSFNGVGSLRNYPLAALAIAGITAARDGRPAAIAAAVDELGDRLQGSNKAVVVDDWDDLDEASRGVVGAVQVVRRCPVVRTLTRGRDASRAPSMTVPSTIDLPVFRYDELGAVLAERYDDPLEASTLSRVYAKSGGNIGLAFALVDAALREERLEPRSGALVAVTDMWSSTLIAHVEDRLRDLSADQRDAVEILSLLGIIDVASVEPLVTAQTLEQLEELGVVKLVPSEGRFLVHVQPPLVVEYFRHTSHPARWLRLRNVFQSAFPDAAEAPEPVEGLPDQKAEFVRLVHEQQRARIAVARSEWVRARTRRAAVDYIRALAGSRDGVDEIDRMLDESRELAGEDSTLAEWALLEGDHLAFRHHDPVRAIAELQREGARLGPVGVPLLARAIEIEETLLGNADLARLPDPEAASTASARVALHRAFAVVLTSRGRIDESEIHIAAIRGQTTDLDIFTAVIAGLNLISTGDLTAAFAHARGGVDAARGRFDPAAMRAYGYLAVGASILDGRYSDAEELLDELDALGEPIGMPPFMQLGLDIMGAVVASRRGDKALAQRRIARVERSELPDAPWPGIFRGIAYAQLASSDGQLEEAAHILERSAEALWARGARFCASLAMLNSLEVKPTQARLARSAEFAAQVPAPLVAAHFLFGEALMLNDPERVMASAARLEELSRYGMAIILFRRACDLFASRRNSSGAARARAEHDRLRGEVPADRYDASRFHSVIVDLTEREQQVGEMAAAGLTNHQIAAALNLSVRTIETHLHRLMRKTGMERRSQLSEYFNEEPAR